MSFMEFVKNNKGWCIGLGAIMGLVWALFLYLIVTSNSSANYIGVGGTAWVITDKETGLEYIKVPGGGITPRMGIDGRQMRVGK